HVRRSFDQKEIAYELSTMRRGCAAGHEILHLLRQPDGRARRPGELSAAGLWASPARIPTRAAAWLSARAAGLSAARLPAAARLSTSAAAARLRPCAAARLSARPATGLRARGAALPAGPGHSHRRRRARRGARLQLRNPAPAGLL